VNLIRPAVGASVQKDMMPNSWTATAGVWGRNHQQGVSTVTGEAWHRPAIGAWRRWDR